MLTSKRIVLAKENKQLQLVSDRCITGDWRSETDVTGGHSQSAKRG